MTEGRFAGDGSEIYDPLCHRCRRYRGWARCGEYPRRIPIAYLTGDAECTKYFKRDEK